MKRWWLISLIGSMAGCGGDGATPDDTALDINAAPPIVGNAMIDSASIENHSEKVPRETGAAMPKVDVTPRHAEQDAAAYPDPDRYSAIGTEPFWAVTVNGSTAQFARPDKPPRRFAVTRSDDAKSTRYQGEGFTMTLSEGPCSDGMSDAIWSDQVAIAFGEGTLKGCGGRREDRRDDAP